MTAPVRVSRHPLVLHKLAILRDRATQPPRVCAANAFCGRLDGPLLRAMTVLVPSNPKLF